MALTAVELDDRIQWYSLCNPTDREVKATLEWLQGIKAVGEGKDDEAQALFRSATQIYDQMPENASFLNNAALVWFSLADVTGNPDDFKQATVRLEKACALKRTDSILLFNTAVALSTAALGEAVQDAIDLQTLKTTGSYDLLRYTYGDSAGRAKLALRLQKNPSMKRAIEYFDRCMLLAPRNPHSYASAWQYYSLTGDIAALTALIKRMEPLTLDQDDERKQALAYYRGERDAEKKPLLEKSIHRGRQTHAAARAKGGATLAAAAGQLVEMLQNGAELGISPDADQMVQLAEESHQAAPSTGSSGMLRSALLFRAAHDLARNDSSLAALLTRAQRSLDADDVLAVALEQPGPLRDKVLAHADVQRAQQLILASLKQFPDSPSSWNWAMLQASHPAEARQIADSLRDNKRSACEARLAALLSPFNPDAALNARWKALALGDQPGAEAALAACRKEGVPLPWGDR